MRIICNNEWRDRIQWIIDDIHNSTGSCLIVTHSQTEVRPITHQIIDIDMDLLDRVNVVSFYNIESLGFWKMYSKIYVVDDNGRIFEESIKRSIMSTAMGTKDLVYLLPKDIVED